MKDINFPNFITSTIDYAPFNFQLLTMSKGKIKKKKKKSKCPAFIKSTGICFTDMKCFYGFIQDSFPFFQSFI